MIRQLNSPMPPANIHTGYPPIDDVIRSIQTAPWDWLYVLLILLGAGVALAAYLDHHLHVRVTRAYDGGYSLGYFEGWLSALVRERHDYIHWQEERRHGEQERTGVSRQGTEGPGHDQGAAGAALHAGGAPAGSLPGEDHARPHASEAGRGDGVSDTRAAGEAS